MRDCSPSVSDNCFKSCWKVFWKVLFIMTAAVRRLDSLDVFVEPTVCFHQTTISATCRAKFWAIFPQHSFHTSLCFITLRHLCFAKLCKLVVRLFIYVIGGSKQRNFCLFPHQCFLLFSELSWLDGSIGQKYSPPH